MAITRRSIEAATLSIKDETGVLALLLERAEQHIVKRVLCHKVLHRDAVTLAYAMCAILGLLHLPRHPIELCEDNCVRCSECQARACRTDAEQSHSNRPH